MCYYDHATQMALRLDQWDMAGRNGALDEATAREIHTGQIRDMVPVKKKSLGVWQRLKGFLPGRRKLPAT